MPDDHFFADYHGPRRKTQVEAEQDYADILACLNEHRPDLVPLALREKLAAKGADWKDRG